MRMRKYFHLKAKICRKTLPRSHCCFPYPRKRSGLPRSVTVNRRKSRTPKKKMGKNWQWSLIRLCQSSQFGWPVKKTHYHRQFTSKLGHYHLPMRPIWQWQLSLFGWPVKKLIIIICLSLKQGDLHLILKQIRLCQSWQFGWPVKKKPLSSLVYVWIRALPSIGKTNSTVTIITVRMACEKAHYHNLSKFKLGYIHLVLKQTW